MARISLDPPRPVSYRFAEWYFRRKFGDVLEPIRAMGHSKEVMRAYGRFEQGAGRWRRLETRISDLADMATVARIGCSWCLDFGYWVMHNARHLAGEDRVRARLARGPAIRPAGAAGHRVRRAGDRGAVHRRRRAGAPAP